MQPNALAVSDKFRKMAIRSILSILLFLATYLFLIITAVATVGLCAWDGYALMTFYPSFVTLMLGAGLISMSLMILFFLIKFIFSTEKKDNSHLLELKAEEQPELFRLIQVVVNEVDTDFPHKVFLSSEVNASVSYVSNFWSMFFPVRKNLQIGMGLLNAVSKTEFKAILAHEFGHFSQRSMRVGSYVYNANMVMYNMLYDSKGYEATLKQWSEASSYFNFFSSIAIWMVTAIQGLLKKIYEIVNINYLALSREMEFHADAAAARVAGSQPMINALLRIELAEQSLGVVFTYYNGKIAEAKKTDNFYPQQYFVMKQRAAAEHFLLEDGLPQISADHYRKLNSTKLVLKDQWSSHPSNYDRISALNVLNQTERPEAAGIAIDLLSNKEELQKAITFKTFLSVMFREKATIEGLETFAAHYSEQPQNVSFPRLYNGYFNKREPYHAFAAKSFNLPEHPEVKDISLLLDDQSVGTLHTLNTMISDLATVEHIAAGKTAMQTFDYDGRKYTIEECPALIQSLKYEIGTFDEVLNKRDQDIFNYFLHAAAEQGKLTRFKKECIDYQTICEAFKVQQKIYLELSSATRFLKITTPFKEIMRNMQLVKALEHEFIGQLEFILGNPLYNAELTDTFRKHLTDYLAKDWTYYDNESYFDVELKMLIQAMTSFYTIIVNKYSRQKKTLLEFQAALSENQSMVASA